MEKQRIKDILNLESKDRYDYLIRKVAEYEQVFLIGGGKGSYVTLGNNEVRCIPVWPEFEIAKQFLVDDWQRHQIKMIKLESFLVWLDKLEDEVYLVAAFPNKDFKSITVRPHVLKKDLVAEIEQYE